jgi:hypothetical protein
MCCNSVANPLNPKENLMYQGHMPDGSSIQRHSAGGAYPYVVQLRDNPRGGYRWELIGPGINGALSFDSQDELDAAVRRILSVRENEDAWAFEVEQLQLFSGSRLYTMSLAAGAVSGGGSKFAEMSRSLRVECLLRLGQVRNAMRLPPGAPSPTFARIAGKLRAE